MSHRPKQTTTDQIFGALSNPTRRDILELLLQGEQPVQVIAERFDMARPSVSEHLRVLKDAHLVSERAAGRQRLYRLETGPLLDVRTWLSPFETYWRERLRDLGDVLDSLDSGEEQS